MANFIYELPAGSFNMPVSNPAPLDRDTGTNGMIYRHLFDDTTEEFVEFLIPELPNTLTAGTVTFVAKGYAVTQAASKFIQLKLYHSAIGTGESWDGAYSSKVSGDKAIEDTQDKIVRHTWTETIANLTWTASDQVRLKLSRVVPAGTDLTGDWGLTGFTIYMPVT